MKLLTVFPSVHRGGAESYVLTIATAAINQGWAVEAAFPNTEGTQGLIKDFQLTEIRYRPLNVGETIVPPAQNLAELAKTLVDRIKAWVEKPFHLALALICLLRSQPDVVLLTLPWPNQGLTTLLACRLLKKPLVVVFQLVPYPLGLSLLKLRLYRWARTCNQTWVAISDNNRQLISAMFQCPVESIIRIYNGVSLHSKEPSPEDRCALRQRIRRSLDLAETTRILLTVARLNGQKGHDYLIPALPPLLKQFPDIHFVWVGDGDQKEILRHKLEEYGTSSSVSMLGHRQDIPDLLQAADLFVFPTYFEGQPFAVLEAMAYGLPVVASATSGIPEVIQDHIHGLLFRTGDSCDLLETLRWGLTHPNAMQTMAINAKERVQEFSRESMIQETLNVLRETHFASKSNQ